MAIRLLSKSASPTEKCFVFVLKLGQILGLLPLEFAEDEPQRGTVRFAWTSPKTLYCTMHLLIQGGMVGLCCCYGHSTGWKYRHIVRTIFYVSGLFSLLDFCRLTRKLPGLLRRWYAVDDALASIYGYPRNLERRVKIMATVTFLYGVLQTTLFIVYNGVGWKIKLKDEFRPESYFRGIYPQIFKYVPYSTWIGLFFQVHYIFTYLRMVYADLFVSLLSTFLSLRFRQITSRLSTGLGNKRTVTFWMETRGEYDKICGLCRTADDVVSNTIFVTFASDLVLILVYLYSCTITDETSLQKAYNMSAFMITTVRALAMLLYVSWVNDESKEPAHVLNSVSTTQYNSEIQRFLQQVNFDKVSFTGNKMYRVTRTLIVHVGGVILTYELILVQFAELNFFNK